MVRLNGCAILDNRTTNEMEDVRWKSNRKNSKNYSTRMLEICINRQYPADSRGIYPHELNSHPLWWNGPSWLSLDQSKWPAQPKQFETNEEKRITKILCNTNTINNGESVEPFSEFSSWIELQRVMAFCLSFANAYRTKTRNDKPMSIEEIYRKNISLQN